MTPSSDMVARIDAAQKQWDEAAITDYTVVMAIGDGTPPVGECVESRLTRIVVQDGTPVQAVKLQQACAVQLDLVATPDDVFDAARAFSGIPSFRINFDPDTGFPTSFSGSDRSVVISQFVVDFELSTEVAVIGWPAVEEALADGRALWADAALDRYEFDLEHIAMVRPPAVTIQVSGDTHTVTSDTGDTAARESQSILGIFDLVDAHPRTNPVVAVFDPDFGYVRDIWLDQSFADGEQEFHIRLTPG